MKKTFCIARRAGLVGFFSGKVRIGKGCERAHLMLSFEAINGRLAGGGFYCL